VTVESAIRYFRRRERGFMRCIVSVTRPTGEPVFDSGTGEVTQPADPVYDGPALVRANQWEGSDREVAETEVRVRSIRIKFPADNPTRRNDLVAIVSSPDARMDDLEFRINDVMVDDWQVSGATFAEEVT
jgi:hypothetical protein